MSIPIAIVGIGCRFPGGASSPEGFWLNLINGIDAIRDVPPERWDMGRFYDPDPNAVGKLYAFQGGFLQEPIDTIDAGLFGLSPREAAVLDPQQRLLLEVLWEAFEDAGIDHSRLSGSRTGVFVGGFTLDHKITQLGVNSREAIFSNTATSSTMVMLSNRLSYTFDLRGPSVSVDTACSSSLVATHLAVQSLSSGECDMAVVGGVNVMTRPEYSITMCKGGFLSPTSRCRAFDRSADGYVRGEGAGIVLLKRVADAESAADRIYATIRATGVNQDGKSAGITTPNLHSQRALVEEVLTRSGLTPREIDVVEAHGTGTAAGDPVEAMSLGTVLSKGREKPAWIGSVKTNIGHLEAGAGVAGLIKLALTLHHREVPPSLHFNEPNENIDFQALKLCVPTTRKRLPEGRSVHGVVNSFGYGGTNAHAVLSSYTPEHRGHRPPLAEETVTGVPQLGMHLLPVSGHSEIALYDRARSLVACPETDLTAIGSTLALRRAHLSYRAVVMGRTKSELQQSLDSLSRAVESKDVAIGRGQPGRRPVFVYTGMGAQWWGMGQDLFRHSPVFRRTVLSCDEIWQSLGGDPITPWFQGDEVRAMLGLGRTGDAIDEPKYAQPGNLVLQVALTETWRAIGLSPAAVIGHSVGEIGAAYAAGTLSLAQAIELVYHRSRLQQRLIGRGGMLAVGLGCEDAERLLEEFGGVVIAADNSPGGVTLAGSHEQLAEIASRLDRLKVFNRKLRVAVPYHSPLMDDVKDGFVAALSHLRPGPPKCPLYSTLLADRVTDAVQDCEYWWRNAAERVRLRQTLELISVDGWDSFVELGPHPVLGQSITEVLGSHGARVSVCHSQKRGVDNHEELRKQFAALYVAGTEIDWRAFWSPTEPVRLPAYPFQREQLWHEAPDGRNDRIGERGMPCLLQIRQPAPAPTWASELGISTVPWLNDHRVDDLVVFPAAGYIATAFDAAGLLDLPTAILSLRLERALIVDGNVEFRVEVRAAELCFYSRKKGSDGRWIMHARTSLVETPRPVANQIDTSHLEREGARPIEPASIYEALRQRGLAYGPAFQGIRAVRSTGGTFEATLALPDDLADRDEWCVHPALLDAGFQAFLTSVVSSDDRPLIPTRIDEVRLHGRVGGTVTARGIVRIQTANALVGDIEFFGANGDCLLEVRGLRCQSVSRSGHTTGSDWLYLDNWVSVATPAPSAPRGRWVCLHQSGSRPSPGILACDDLEAAGVEVQHCEVNSQTLSDVLKHSFQTTVDGVVVSYNAAMDDPAGIEACSLLLATFQQLQNFASASARIIVLTDRSQAVIENEVPEVANSPLFGLTRVAQNELTELSPVIIDVGSALVPGTLAAVMLAGDRETEWAVRGDRVYVRRLEQCPEDPVPELAEPGAPAALRIERPGGLDSLQWLSCERRAPAAGEIEIRVLGAPLNFKDYIKAMGFLPPSYLESTYYRDSLGLEAAGIVTRVGPGVTDWKVGDEVVTPARDGCMRSYVTESTNYAVRKPEHHSFAEAGCYINFVTAHYGLAEIGRLSAGESVLIHSAAGGVGLAALQVAAQSGATVFATAGSEHKRAYLRNLGLKYVYDSRSLAFADEILSQTGGRGVDVVLNAQPGDMMRRSLDVLAPYGRFVEIGKRAVLEFDSLRLSAFDKNLLFAAIDVDRMMADNPKLFRRLLDEVHSRFCDRRYGALPATNYDAGEVENAFRELGRGQHIGKISLNIDSDFEVRQDPASRAVVRSDRCYLITGGFGGFGRAVARWLVELGGRHLVLASRSGALQGDAPKFVNELRNCGVTVQTPLVDISDRDAVRVMIEALKDGPPLAGVFHTAAVLDDAVLKELSPQQLMRVMKTKAAGALWLDEATAGMSLDHFVLFSSVSAVTGNPGQGSYVAANALLDSLAERRHATGKAALSINWGVLSDVGMVARNSSVASHLSRLGIRGFSSVEALAALRNAMQLGRPRIGLFDIDWTTWTTAAVESSQPRFEAVAVRSGTGQKHPLAEKLSALDPDGRLAFVREQLCSRLSRVMQIPVEKIDVELGLDTMGVDSLMATELAVAVESDLHVELSTVLLMQGPSVTELCHRILKLILVDAVREANVDEMTEEELDAFLAAELIEQV